ncbi:uncharacterized protein [Hyperolius riggenbachi]|uniref:uncharacterized protein isoform X2 n=1 Tax=Hyperolius riggenbachi TaxID=752182 RepID=UPI0035A3C1AE
MSACNNGYKQTEKSGTNGHWQTKQGKAMMSATRRQVVIDYPLTWTDIGKEELQVVTLKEYSQEYNVVKENFLKSAGSQTFMVVKIQRIQNFKLFQSYTIKKKAVGRKNPGKRNVQCLYHGTTLKAINNINQGGFNRAYCGKNATVIGSGTYFAVRSSYSCKDTYSVPDTDGLKYVYQASVITGRYCKGKSYYVEPPYINDDPSEDRYDSTADRVPNANLFAVFYDDSAYPDYLITFKPVVINYPPTWTDMGKEELQVVTLKEDSQEYKDIKENFLKSAGPKKFMVVKIQRIQNVKLFQSYTIKKQSVRRNNPGKRNVRCLYHGTASEAISNINQGGFNRAYCGKNATVIGSGTYFAVRSSFSCRDTYSVPDPEGHKYIYQASVITGRYCEGNSDDVEPPYINDDPNEDRYDSTADRVPNANFFAVFYDDSAYPDYLITFKRDTSFLTRLTSRCCIS